MTTRIHKTSKIFQIPFDELQNILDNSSTFVDVLATLGYDKYNGNHRTLKKRLNSESFNMEKFNENYKKWKTSINATAKKLIPLSECLVENSSYSRKKLKIRLVEENMMEYKCKKCGLSNEWQSEKLSLQLEHINGINNDNRLENLCFLCPNCHSQTKTFGGRNAKQEHFCSICKKESKGYGDICADCSNRNRPLKFIVEKEELQKLVLEMPMTTIGKKFNVSDNTIRNRCKSFGIEVPKKMQSKWLKGKPKENIRKFHVEKETLEKLIKEKKSWNDLARLFNVAAATLKARAVVLGIILPKVSQHPNHGKLSTLTKDKLEKYITIDKLNIPEIAKLLGVSHPSLRRRIKVLNAGIV